MQLPFTPDQFFDVMIRYNQTVLPAQVFLNLAAILTMLWAWTALAFHLVHFTAINKLAYGFAGLSIVGAGVFAWQGVGLRALEFEIRPNLRSVTGVLSIAYALIVYPIWSTLAGHPYPTLPASLASGSLSGLPGPLPDRWVDREFRPVDDEPDGGASFPGVRSPRPLNCPESATDGRRTSSAYVFEAENPWTARHLCRVSQGTRCLRSSDDA